MENNPPAAGDASATQTEANPTQTTNIEPAQEQAPPPSPNMHGFTEAQLAEMEKFYSSNGGFEKAFGRVKSVISNPQQFENASQTAIEPQQDAFGPQMQQQPTSQQYQPQMPQYKAPEGSITAEEFLAQQYFQGLSRDPKYESISEQIATGDVLKEMSAFNIKPLNQDGSINDTMVRRYLDLKAQTVPAKPTETEPNASAAPTVTYTEVGEGGITSMEQAYKILMEPGSPHMAKAEEYIKKSYNKK